MEHVVVESVKSFDEAGHALEAAIADHRFGVLHIHDVRQTLTSKGIPFDRAVRIFDVCNLQRASGPSVLSWRAPPGEGMVETQGSSGHARACADVPDGGTHCCLAPDPEAARVPERVSPGEPVILHAGQEGPAFAP